MLTIKTKSSSYLFIQHTFLSVTKVSGIESDVEDTTVNKVDVKVALTELTDLQLTIKMKQERGYLIQIWYNKREFWKKR